MPALPLATHGVLALQLIPVGGRPDTTDAEEAARVEALSARMVQRAQELEGTCTGEHGVGLHKMGYLLGEHGEGALALMRTIKRALDPKNIMNPGKMLAL